MRPKALKYAETHEWVKAKGKKAVLGITDFAVEQLQDLVNIELPETGTELETGSSFGEIESVKTVSDLVSPISGKVTEVNKAVVDSLDVLAKDPFGDGWLVKVDLKDADELKDLLSAEEYEEFIESQSDKDAKDEDDEEEEEEEDEEGEDDEEDEEEPDDDA